MVSNIPVPSEPDERKSDSWLGETPGDTVAGTVTKRETCTPKKLDKNGDPLPPFEKIWIKQNDGAELGVPCMRRDLRDFVDFQDPQVGDQVAVKYFGPAPDGFGFRYGTSIVKAKPQSDVPADGIPGPSDTTGGAAVGGDDTIPFAPRVI